MQWSNEFDWIVNHGWAFCNILVQSPEKCRKQIRSFIESFELASFIFASHNLWSLSSMTLNFFLAPLCLFLWYWSVLAHSGVWMHGSCSCGDRHRIPVVNNGIVRRFRSLNSCMGFHCSKSLTQTKFIAPLLHLLQLKGFQKAFPSSRFHSEIDSRRPPLYQIPKHSSCMKDL